MSNYCGVCNVRLSGPVPYAAHLAGRPHRLKLESVDALAVQMRGLSVSGSQNRQAGPLNNHPNPNGTRAARGRGAQTNHPHNALFTRRGTSRPAPVPRPSVPPRGIPENGQSIPTNPGDPPKSQYLIDFGVVRKEDASLGIQSVDVQFHQDSGFSRESTSLEATIEQVKVSRAHSVRGFQLQGQTYLSPGCYRVNVKFNPQTVRRGVHVVRLHLTYHNGDRDETKWHKLKAIVGTPEDHQELKPIAPFTRSKRPDKNDWHRRRMIRGKPPVSTPDFRRLDFYDIPEPYRRNFNIENDRSGNAVEISLQSLLPISLDITTYQDYWTHMLWHEELQMEIDLKMYDMNRVPITRVESHDYSLAVPGLLEKRPSVIVTDLVALKPPGDPYRATLYGGYVTAVQLSNVILRMHESFSSLPNQLWDIRFTVNRLLLRRMHDAISKASAHERILFPNESHRKPSTGGSRLASSLDRKVASNFQQTRAVRHIVSQLLGDIPFVIFGPPGTGKTTALVEAIHQVVLADPKNRVLVCAPSNTATDLIATRLAKMHNEKELLRLNAPARLFDLLPPELRKYSPIDLDKKFKAPPKGELQKFRIVASTCFYASIPQALDIQNHFTHVFIDEAGHASEPEIMVAVLQNAGPKTNIIVCGDPMQLGPIVQSKSCAKLGMSVSFLDRLMRLPIYSGQAQNEIEPKIVKLLQNYRSHPALLSFSNVAFYKGELESCADPVHTASLEKFSELPQQGFPIIFHSICGHNMQEAKSPSFFNIDEATLVKHYVQALLSDRRLGLKSKDIGVISPYRQQCVKVKQLLQGVQRDRHEGVEVKVTEDWQGQEKRVIIVSTVRSDPELPEHDATEFLGFVSSWRRTNVTLTRAQALLIVIGNAATLELDPAWYFFMNYVYASGGWRGDEVAYPPVLTVNPFKPTKGKVKNYEEFDDERWDTLMDASRAFNAI